jgi:cysteinyl-tRNA synthetase
VREANRSPEPVGDRDLREMLGLLGLGDLTPMGAEGDLATIDPDAVRLLAERETARRERDFELADRLREEIRQRGWEIRDGEGGAELIPAADR